MLSGMLKLYPDDSKNQETESQSADLEELLEHVGEGALPKEPIGGIPKQWIPSWIRWPIRLVFLPWVLLDLFAQRVARVFIRTPFKQIGSCKKRGYCCHYILIP